MTTDVQLNVSRKHRLHACGCLFKTSHQRVFRRPRIRWADRLLESGRPDCDWYDTSSRNAEGALVCEHAGNAYSCKHRISTSPSSDAGDSVQMFPNYSRGIQILNGSRLQPKSAGIINCKKQRATRTLESAGRVLQPLVGR